MICKIFISIFSIMLAISFGQVGKVSFNEARLVPKMLNYQGYLTDALGSPITDNLDMTFKIFDAVSSGNELWFETQTNVLIERGVFSVILGETTPIPDSVFADFTNTWLELTLEGPQTLTPRTRITSVGYAYTSTYSDTAEYAKNAAVDNDWTISGNNMYSAVPGSVGVGVISPAEKLDVNGAVNVFSFYKIGGDRVFSNAGTNNIFVGVGAGENNTTGIRNTFSGYEAGYDNTTGYYNTFSGYQAGFSNTEGCENTFSGYEAGYSNTTGSHNTFSGRCAGYSNTIGHFNTFLGCQAGRNNTTGYHNTFSGCNAGLSNTTGRDNTFLGCQAGGSNAEGDSNVFIGYRAGYNETGSNKLYIANGWSDANVLIYGEFDTRRVGIGTVSPTEALDVNGNCKADTFIGDGSQLTGIAVDNDWTIDGNNMYSAVPGSVGVGVISPAEKLDVDGAVNVSSLYKIGGDRVLSNAGTKNIFVGVGAGENNTGEWNTFLGDSAGYLNTTGSYNTFLGLAAGAANTTGYMNTFSGDYAGASNTTGYKNTFSGSRAGMCNTTGYDNTFLGHCVGYLNTTGSYNTFLGLAAGGSNTEGAYNVFIGYHAGYYNTTDSSKLYIANDSSDANVLIYGEFDNRRVGIGTVSPTATLDVNGSTGYNQVRMRTSYTPTGTGDTNGNIGDIAWGDNYIYIKTSAGWKRAALSTW